MNRRLSKCFATFRSSGIWLPVLLASQLSGCLDLGRMVGEPAAQSSPGLAITSPASATVDEQVANGFYTATASASVNPPIQFSVSGGADGGSFAIDPVTGDLSFVIATSFESPADGDRDNVYEVEVQAQDAAGLTGQRLVRVAVMDVNEAPIFTSPGTAIMAENLTLPYTAAAVDPDGSSVSYAIDGGIDGALFTINPVSGRMQFVSAPDFEAPQDQGGDNVYDVDVRADDPEGMAAVLSVSIRVTNASNLRIDVGFPTPGANLGGIDSTAVTGRLADLEDGAVEFADVAFVDVNGAFAVLDPSDASRWSGSAAGFLPTTDLTALVDATNGVAHSLSMSEQNEAIIVRPDLMALGQSLNRLLVADGSGIGSLVEIDLAAGTRRLVPNLSQGTGPLVLFPQAAIFENANNRVLLLDPAQSAMMSLDLATGDRAFVSGAGVGAGPDFDFPGALAFNPFGDRVLVVDSNLAALLAVDPLTGDRSIVSDAVTGGGIPFLYPTVIAVDPRFDRALVVDAFHEAIIAVDLATGDRSVVADALTGTSINFPIAMQLDEAGNRLLLLDFNLQSIVSVDLVSGAGSELSGPAVGSGPSIAQPRSMAFDALRDRILVSDLELQRMLSIDLMTGDRTLFADTRTGAGTPIAAGAALGFAAGGDHLLVAHRQAAGGALVRVELDGGDRTVLSDAALGAGPAVDAITGVDLDTANSRVILADDGLDALLAVDTSSGDRTVLSSVGVGSGPLFTEPAGVAYDAGNGRALLLDRGLAALFSIDATGGDRSVVSRDGVAGSGPALVNPVALDLDAAANRVLVADPDLDALLSIDLATGDRSVVADNAIGAGPPMDDPTSVAVDTAGNRAFVALGNNPARIYAVDLASGDRAVVVSPIDQASAPLHAVTGLHFDAAYERLFVLDSDIEGLLVVDVASGQRAIVSR